MSEKSIARLGAVCAYLVALSYFIVGLAYLLLPADQQGGTLLHDPEGFLVSMARDSTLITIHHLVFGLGALLALAVVTAVLARLKPADGGLIRWTSHLAYLGFGVTAVDNFRILTLEPIRAALFASGDAATRSAVAATGYFISVDPHMWLGYGLVGIWMFTVSLVALRRRLLPRALAIFGVAGGFLYFFVEFGTVLRSRLLIALAAGFGAMAVAPLWYAWVGRVLGRTDATGSGPQGDIR